MSDQNGGPTADAESEQPAGVSRRGLFGLLGAGAAGLALGAAGGAAVTAAVAAQSTTPASRVYPFFGAHQAGITTPAQDRLHFAAFDVGERTTRDELRELLIEWSAAAAQLTHGLEIGETGAVGGSDLAPPEDTGEALGLPASGLTITFGFGPSLF